MMCFINWFLAASLLVPIIIPFLSNKRFDKAKVILIRTLITGPQVKTSLFQSEILNPFLSFVTAL